MVTPFCDAPSLAEYMSNKPGRISVKHVLLNVKISSLKYLKSVSLGEQSLWKILLIQKLNSSIS